MGPERGYGGGGSLGRKKKLSAELTALFPERQQEGEQLALASQQKRRSLALLDYLLTQDEAHLRTVREVDAWLLELARPDQFSEGDPDNIITHLHRSFENLCAILAAHGTPDAGSLPLFQFHARLGWLQKKMEAKHQE
ncbi:hypothetical protein [Hymenobacter sp. 102]|uniref:hypothetical protein n=1 Tax=Hymenobacter sp. 102 TaxID=3403152 RepID=UPI003CF32184